MKGNLRRFRRWGAYPVLYFLIVLTGCSANAGFGPFKPTFQHQQLSPLTIPNFHRMAAFTHLAPSTDPDNIYGISTFLSPGQAHPRAIVMVDGDVYVTKLDGSNAKKLELPYPCYSPGVSASGGWLACPHETDQSHDAPQLQITSLSPDADTNLHVAILQGPGFYLYPAWAPNGRMLAILHDQINTGGECAISLYTSTPPYLSFKHLTEVEVAYIPSIKVRDACDIGGLAWSPDGKWLTIKGGGGIALVALTSLLQTFVAASGAVPARIDVPDTAIQPVAIAPSDGNQPSLSALSAFSMAWNPRSGALTYLSFSDTPSLSEEITTYDPGLAQRQVALHIPLTNSPASQVNDISVLEHLDAVTWTPDGQQMLIVVSQSMGCVDCTMTYPSDVYLYTPTP